MRKSNIKVVFTPKIAGYLLAMGATLIKVGKDRKFPNEDKVVYLFTEDEMLNKAFENMTQNMTKINEMRDEINEDNN